MTEAFGRVVEVREAVAAARLGAVHGFIGARNQKLSRVCILRIQRDADAGTRIDLMAADPAGSAQ
jgi:hypothetical protein